MSDTSTAARPRRPMRSAQPPAMGNGNGSGQTTDAIQSTGTIEASAPRGPAEVVIDTDEGPKKFVRQPFGQRRSKLDNSQRPGFHRHWFNDWPGMDRIGDALRAGYTHVKDSAGKNMQRVVGTSEAGGGLISYRMEIPQEWYDADQKAKDIARAEQLAQLRRGVSGGHVPGQDGAYSPTNKAGGTGADIKNAR